MSLISTLLCAICTTDEKIRAVPTARFLFENDFSLPLVLGPPADPLMRVVLALNKTH